MIIFASELTWIHSHSVEIIFSKKQMEGRVVHGEKRGRLLGYPTANIETVIPEEIEDGIYAGEIEIENFSYPAAISVGTNPTFNGIKRTVEAFIIDQGNLDLYDLWVRVRLIQKIREQVKFRSVDELIEQIKLDLVQCRILLEL